MIRRIYILLILLFATLRAEAQLAGGKIAIDNLTAVEMDGAVTVSFDAQIAKNTVAGMRTYILAPVLTDGNYRVSLPAIVVEGGRSKMSRRRRAWVAGEPENYPVAAYAANGQTVNYTATVEAQEWMHGGRLDVECVAAGCCSAETASPVTVAEGLKLYEEPQDKVIVTEVRRFVPRTVADSLSIAFPFVQPAEMFDPEDPFGMCDEERESAIIVYFHQARHDIDADLRDNGQTLRNLTETIKMIMNDADSKVERVVVAGFASPEGSSRANDRLALSRATTIKRHLLRTTGLNDSQVWMYNGSVDWKGLRMLVEKSDMPDKQAVLDIIDNAPNDTRADELMNLNEGEPYRYMFEQFFPLLRNGTFIRVYYSNRDID